MSIKTPIFIPPTYINNSSEEECIVHDIIEDFLTKEKYVFFQKEKEMFSGGKFFILKEEFFYKHFKPKENAKHEETVETKTVEKTGTES